MIPEVAESNLHSAADRTMEEISFFGTLRFNETSVKLRFSDGTADFRGCAAGHIADGNKLTVIIKDIHYPLTVELHYEVFEESDIIKRYTRVVNNGTDDIVFDRIYSSELGIPETDLNIINFGGTWAAEFQQKSDSLRGGKKVYENLRGSAGHVVNPCFIVHKNASEDSGAVYFGCLAYSGNYKITVEAMPYEYTKILAGISDTDFSKTLAASESFDAPAAYIGYTENGFADMSLKMHSFCRRYIMPESLAEKPLKVLYNSWCATGFNVTCAEQKLLAEKAAALGAEMFVVDDGWFGVRNNDLQGLGDWYADKSKFPNDISELIEYVHKLGMSFGLWVEPEMVNEDSEFFRSRPDLIYRFPNRTPITARHQLVLDLTREEVVKFIIDTLDRLLTDYDIEYIKWDMNRYISETVTENPKEMWDKHIRNLYHIIDEIRRRHPKVEFEACASGGGRIDLGIMQYFDEFWTSDNTDALDRLEIQEGYSLMYPPKYMRAWFTDNGRKRCLPVAFRMHCSMCGALGIGSNLNTLPNDEFKEIGRYIEDYKRVREVVQFGDVYRLKSFRSDDFHCVEYIYNEKCVVFAFLINQRFLKTQYTVKLKGLCGSTLYSVKIKDKTEVKSGGYLMNYGITVPLSGDYDSIMIEISTEGGSKKNECKSMGRTTYNSDL